MNKTSSAIVRTILLGTSCLSVLALGAAKADPTGGTVVTGSATITSKPGNTVINQASDRALINWQNFSIAAGGTVKFNQPGSASITVNRVTGSQPSSIFGSLLANGQVWIINGNGILFGKGSQVNVGGLIATTSDLADRDFQNGNFSFNGGTGASVVNQGTIRTKNGGSAVLSGASVSNQGLIAADTGTVVLGGASAFTVDFDGDNLLRYAITTPAGQADNGQTGVSNSGTINAAGGRVIMTARAAANVANAVVNNTGMISATSAKVQNGEVILDGGDGDVAVSGTIDASGARGGQTGGAVSITGRNVTVADNTLINVSGDAGGGTVRIGGDLHGAGPLQNAANVTVGAATIRANAVRSGNGGTLVVYSNGLTDFSGIFSAIGGARGGNGGLIETSGHTLNIGVGAKIDTRAPRGKTGNWLLDPDTIIIAQGEGGGTPLNGGTLDLGTDPGATDFVRPSTIIAALANSNVTLEASNLIEVDDALIYSSANSLSLLSEGGINLYASVQNTLSLGGGAINLVAGWDGATAVADVLTTPDAYGNNQGEIFLNASDADVSVGSASGRTLAAGGYVTLYGTDFNAQLGYHGAGGGAVDVYAQNGIALTGGDPFGSGAYAMIGNGALDGSVSGPITGDIHVETGGTLSLSAATDGCEVECADAPRTLGIGNAAGIGEEPPTGSTTIIAADYDDDNDANGGFSRILLADIAYGDVTVGATDSTISIDDALEYASDHALTLLSTGDIDVTHNVINSGNGAIKLVAGWNGVVLDPAGTDDKAAFGLNEGSVYIGGEGGVSVGSKGGAVTVLTSYLELDGVFHNAQLGYHGAGGGDINVYSTGDVALYGSQPGDFAPPRDGGGDFQTSPTGYAMIGNGAIDGSVSGAITGNIFVKAGGTLILATETGQICFDCGPGGGGDEIVRQAGGDGRTVGIGNEAGIGEEPPTGSVTILTGDIDDGDDFNGGFSVILAHDLGQGDFTLGNLYEENPLTIDGDFSYSSSHTLSLLAAGDIEITGTLRNDGTGAINLVAGWDGTTVDAAHFGDDGVFGRSGGNVTIGGEAAEGDASAGAASGDLNVYTANLNVSADNGYAQLGYHGAGGGYIHVVATGNITARGGSDADQFAMVGNGSLGEDVDGDITGDISLKAGGQTVFLDGTSTDEAGAAGGQGWLGNVAARGFNETGNVTALTRTGFFAADFIAADLGTTADTGGNVFVGFTDGEVGDLFIGGLDYNSAHDFTFAVAGSMQVTGSVTNAGSGAVTLVAGWDGETVGGAADILAAHAYGIDGASMTLGGENQFDDVSVGSAGGTTTLLTHDLTVAPMDGYYAQVGYHGAAGGDIRIVADGDLTLTAGAAAHDYAMIGNGSLNGDVSGDITGNIDAKVGGSTTLTSVTEGGEAWVGNVAANGFTAAGNVLFVTHDFDSTGSLSDMIAADLAGGDVMLGITDFEAQNAIDGDVIYNSSHTLSLLTAGSFGVFSQIQNGGSGDINIVTGWNGTTLDAAHFLDAGVFGNNGGALFVGGEIPLGGVAVGSAGGHTNIGASSVTLSGVNGYAQIGYHGASGGAINVKTLQAITLNGGEGASFAQIGNGTVFGSNSAGGDVALSASSIGGNTSGTNAVVGANLKLAAASGNIGASGNALRIASTSLQLTTAGGNVYLASPGNGVALAGVNLSGGSLTLSAGGAITQTAALHTGLLNVSTTTGAITLTDASNGFGALTVTTASGFDASFTNAALLTVQSANVGGTLTLVGGTGINQGSGSLVAGGLVASSLVGGITLTNPANSFGTLSLHTNAGNGATIVDSRSVALGAVNVGNILTLTAGGAITQTAALHSGSLNIATTTGAITLTDSSNLFGQLTVTTHNSDNASFASTLITLNGAHVGGTLTLASGSGILQGGALVAGGVVASATTGNIILDNASNAFGTLQVHTNAGGIATVVDTTAVALGASDVSGKFTLAAGGAITQTGALFSGAFDISTVTGAITLTNSGNNFGALTVTTHGTDNASFAHSGLLTVASAHVGGKLTLTGATGVGQTGAIVANGLDVTALAGNISLTDAGNSFGTLSVATAAGGNATILDSTAVAIAGGNVGGLLTLTANGAISQTGALTASALSVSATGGGVTLTNTGNAIGTLSVSTSGAFDANITDSTALVLASATVGGKLTLSGGGAITQTGALTTHGLAVSTTAGAITLARATNNVAGTAQFSGPGAVTFANSVATTLGASSAGGDFTLLSKGNLNIIGSLQSNTGAVTLVAGWDGTTADAAHFGDSGVYGNNTGATTGNIVIGGSGASGAVAVGSKSGATSLYANNVFVGGVNGAAQLGYHGTGGGAIQVRALHDMTLNAVNFSSMLGNGSLTNDVTGAVTGDIDIRIGGTAFFNGSVGTPSWLGNKSSGGETGNVLVLAADSDGTQDCGLGCFAQADIAGGDITLALTGTGDHEIDDAIAYNSTHNLTLLTGGALLVSGSLQNAGSGAVTILAGWDGHTLTPSSFGTAGVYGNNGKGVVIGSSAATGNAALGSAGGATSVYGASLTLAATNGYALLGYHGAASGAILVKTTGGVTLTGGASANRFAQIGHGGYQTSGNHSGAITITAGGDLTLSAGAGSEAYAQVGHGGAESNTGANGYSNVAPITVSAANVILNAGTGTAAYVQIGNGGYKSGLNLAGGTANNGGDITVTSGHLVSLNGNGADAYAQIGNGGSQSNLNPAASAGGSDSGNIVVHAPNGAAGSVTLTAGASANAYAQIGNGGYAINMGASSTVANWTVTGNVTVSDLMLIGGGPNAFSVIGNGDMSHNGYGNISGDITIDTGGGDITYTDGVGPHAPGTIGNGTGHGTISGTISGAHPPSEGGDIATDPVVLGNIAVNTANNGSPTNTVPVIPTVVVTETNDGKPTNTVVTVDTSKPGPLASLDDKGADSSTPNAADSATVVIADSLDGSKKAGSQSILNGMLKQTAPTGAGVHGVPPADQDFSSWGNEALWQ